MDVDAMLAAFVGEGFLPVPVPDVDGAVRGEVPKRTTRVLDRMPELPKDAEERESILAQRARARQVERAEREGQPIAEYGKTVTWIDEDGKERRQVCGRLSEMHRAFPDAEEAKSRARAGVSAPAVPKRIVQL